MLKTRATTRAVAGLLGVLALSLLSCGREVTGPGGVSAFRRAMFQVDPRFPTLANGVSAESSVPFERVRVTLRNPDGTIAKDTVVTFPPGADAVSLSLTIALPANAPNSGVPLSVSMGYVNAAGDTVFKGGPFSVNVTPQIAGAPAPPPVQVPLLYTGVGSTAAGVRISPKTTTGQNGDQLSFTAVAVDAAGVPISGTPIVYATSTPTIVSIPASTAPNAVLLNARGTGTVIAQLLTGQADTARIAVSLKATTLALVEGGNQSVGAGLDLPQNIRVRVTAPDGVGVGGIPLTIAVASGTGTVRTTSTSTLADGHLTLEWKLGPEVGPQSLRVTAAGLTGSPLTINATATQLPPIALTLATPPTAAPINTRLATVRVTALDAAGIPSPLFASAVTVALGANPSGATLSGTRTRTAVNGVAAFDDLTIDKPGSGYTLVFSATNLSGITSPPFDVQAGSAARLAFTVGVSAGTAGVAFAPTVTVTALDASGNIATGFTGNIALGLTGTASGALSGTTTRAAVAGVAAFPGLSVDRAGSAYTLHATATDVAPATSAPFTIVPAGAARVQVISGDGLSRPAGSAIDSVVALVTDALGNGVSGRNVSFVVKSGGGAVSAATVTTSATGRAAVRWTLGTVSGSQTLEVASDGLAGSPSTVTATATAGAATQLRVAQAPAARWTAGQATEPIIVHVLDADGNRVTAFTGSVAIAVSSGPAASPIFGLTTVPAIAGVATFRELAVQKAGTYDFAFTSGTLRGATSTGIVVTSGTNITMVADSGASQSGVAGTALPANFVLRATDNYGNIAVGVPITWTVTTGGGTVNSASGVTDEFGRARTRLTLGAGGGTHAVTASAPGATP
ncbi:MAG: hypothetical protein P3B98_11115, partial [Gemmatimonadota bacterium]|nr:hypothetical protein [Gemmatimonadota bacterium]